MKSGLKVWGVTVLALAFGGLIFVVGGGILYFLFTNFPIHPRADAVPSRVAAQPAAEWASAVGEARRLARSMVKGENLPGVSIAVAIDGNIVWAEGFGWSDIEHRVLTTPRTRYRTGAVSMALTAAAAGLLHDRGVLDLDAPVQRYVPAFPQKEWPITTRQLMGHVAGVRTGPDEHEEMGAFACRTTAEGLERFADAALRFEPGTKFRYSTFGWVLVSAVIESAAREPFFRFMEREVFQPLGMIDTGPDIRNGDVASFYFPRMAERTTLGLDPTRPVDYSCLSGAGAFLSTPSDLARFGSALMNGSLVKPATVTLLQTPLRLRSGASTQYGLGWHVQTVTLRGAPARVVGSDANPFGSTLSLIMFPDRRVAIAVASNVSYAKGVAPFGLTLAELFAPAGR